jgi:hypothetical protein
MKILKPFSLLLTSVQSRVKAEELWALIVNPVGVLGMLTLSSNKRNNPGINLGPSDEANEMGV